MLSRTFPPSKPACCYIKPSIVICACSAEGERFATEWLEVRLDGDIVANLRKEIDQEVMHFIVPDYGEPPVGQERAFYKIEVSQ